MIVDSQLNGRRPQRSDVLVEQADLPLEDGQQVINPIEHAIHAQQEMMNIGLRDSGESSSHLHSMMRSRVQATKQDEDGRRAMPVAAALPQDAYGHHGHQKSGVSKRTNASLKPQHEQEQSSINSNRLSHQKANSKKHKPTMDDIRSSRKPNEELVLSAAADEFQVIDTVMPKVAMKNKQYQQLYREEDESEKNTYGQKVQDGLR